MVEIRSVLNTSSRNFHILFYDIKYIIIQYYPTCDFKKKLLHVLKKAVANQWLNVTTEADETQSSFTAMLY